ncbi:hypothetical protein SLE2022_362440 [Rubroshorea leprosula]
MGSYSSIVSPDITKKKNLYLKFKPDAPATVNGPGLSFAALQRTDRPRPILIRHPSVLPHVLLSILAGTPTISLHHVTTMHLILTHGNDPNRVPHIMKSNGHRNSVTVDPWTHDHSSEQKPRRIDECSQNSK